MFQRLILVFALIGVPASSQSLETWQQLGTSLRQAITNDFGVNATGPQWVTRKAVGDILDVLWSPLGDGTGTFTYHPFYFAEVRCLTRGFYFASLDEMIATMDGPPVADGVRTYFWGASGVVVEAWLPSGPGGALEPYRAAFDIADVVYGLSGAIAPTCFTLPDYVQRIEALADRIDAYYISHIHGDHVSHQLAVAMINRGKPIYVTQETFLYATLIGLPTAGVSVLQTGQTTINPWVERAVHQGTQLGYQNNITLLTFDVPVAGSATTGVTFGAFGDFDGQTNWVSFLQGLVTTGFLKDHVIVSNYSDWDPVGTAILSPDVRLQTPLFDFGHPVDTTQPFGMHIPIEAQFNAAARVPLFFGESFLYPQDL